MIVIHRYIAQTKELIYINEMNPLFLWYCLYKIVKLTNEMQTLTWKLNSTAILYHTT